MKNKRLLGIYLVLMMLIMTACSTQKNQVQGNPQEYETAIQETLQANENAAQEITQAYGDNVSENLQEQADAISETSQEYESPAQEQTLEAESSAETAINNNLPLYGEYYYDLANVVLYLDVYDELPLNYITKSEAQALGWEGGSVEKYKEGAAIGGDRFGNREGLLPEASGRSYTECDIDTNGYSSRGSRRLVFSNDGLYFYTSDHYETFSEVTITEDYEVIW